jgi:D-alanyl-D-alanine carboxypeptidase/D-alanyl-D-alanine-endopeptidase (penicillin-binding protein 4)
MVKLEIKTGLIAAAAMLAMAATAQATPPEKRAVPEYAAWHDAINDTAPAPERPAWEQAVNDREPSATMASLAGHRPTGRQGFVLMDAVTGEVLSGHNPDEAFIPASLSKIPTTLITLASLGEEHRFTTRLVANGTVTEGVLIGDLQLVGSGDPSLRIRHLKQLAQQLAGQGIHRITGKLTFDASALPRTRHIDRAQPKNAHYNPAVSGLNLNYNLHTTAGSRRTVSEPGRWAARQFYSHAARLGIKLPKPVRAEQRLGGETLAAHTSAPVSEILRRMMKRSTNLTAEALGALSNKATGPAPASLGNAAWRTADWLKTSIGDPGGEGWRGFRLANHSGLSTRSRATPRQMASILRLGYLRFGTRFTDLHHKTAPAGYQAYTLRGKMGTMRFVRGYAGFLTVGGREMIFAIMANDASGRALADAGRSGLPSKAWMRKARQFEHLVLSEWVADHWPSGPARNVAMAEPITVQVVQTPVQPTLIAAIPSPITAPRMVRTMQPIE